MYTAIEWYQVGRNCTGHNDSTLHIKGRKRVYYCIKVIKLRFKLIVLSSISHQER